MYRVVRLQFSTGRNEKAGIRPVYPHESTPCHDESRFLEQSYVKALRNPGSKTIANVDGHRKLENLVMYTPRNAPAARKLAALSLYLVIDKYIILFWQENIDKL